MARSTQNPGAPSSAGSSGARREKRQRNEGEGNRTAAREYNEKTKDFVESGRVDEAAKEAEHAIEGKERDELLRDEATGRSRARS